MIDLNTLTEFSRTHCVSICAFLVPANLIGTTITLYFLYLGRSTLEILPFASIAMLFAVTLFLHIGTWLVIGVVMAPTFILFVLGLTCFLINWKAVTDRQRFEPLLQNGLTTAHRLINWG